MEKFLIIILIILFSSCQEKSKKENSISSSQSIDRKTIEKVKIFISSDDEKLIDFFNILSYNSYYGSRPLKFSSKKISNDSLFITLNSLRTPQIIEFQAFGKEPYRSRIFVTPGDSILLNFKNGSIEYKGNSPAHFRFYNELSERDNQWSKISFNGKVDTYKRKADSIYNNNVKFFQSFILENRVSEDFKKTVEKELEFEYRYNLIAPRMIESQNPEITFNDLVGPINLIKENFKQNSEQFLDYSSYLGEVNIESFQDKSLINNDYYKRALVLYIRHYFSNHEYLNYTKKNYKDELSYIQENLTGKSKQYALIRLMKDYHEKGFGRDELNHKILKEDIENLQTIVKEPTYAAELSNLKEDLKVYNSEIPASIRQEKLLTTSLDTIIFQEILEKNSEIKMFQFWAYKDRCTICAEGILKLKDLHDKNELPNNIRSIHISINRDSQAWIDEVNFFQNEMKAKDNYMIIEDNMESGLLEYFRIRTGETIELPRYLILNNKNEVLLNSIPLPSDSLEFKKTIRTLK